MSVTRKAENGNYPYGGHLQIEPIPAVSVYILISLMIAWTAGFISCIIIIGRSLKGIHYLMHPVEIDSYEP